MCITKTYYWVCQKEGCNEATRGAGQGVAKVEEFPCDRTRETDKMCVNQGMVHVTKDEEGNDLIILDTKLCRVHEEEEERRIF